MREYYEISLQKGRNVKVFLLFAMAIIFISVFFILSISTELVEEYKNCLEYQDLKHCNINKLGSTLADGMFIIACFILIDIGVITLLIKHYLGKSEYIDWESIT